ncbi:MAG: FhaA domain-containing protein [Desertimonas sp.]
MVLQSLERRLERIVEGVFRGSRSAIRPIELGRRLVRAMDDQRSVDVKGRRVVPNDFTISLSERDLASFEDIHDVLTAELVEAAREYAREEGYHFMGPVRVDLISDPDQRAGRFEVLAQLRQGKGGAGAGSLVMPSGQRISLGDRPIDLGRSSECAITLSDQNVSRRHAEVRPGPRGYAVADLGSTNGTMVNGTRIAGEQSLVDGDIVNVGSTYIRFEAQ